MDCTRLTLTPARPWPPPLPPGGVRDGSVGSMTASCGLRHCAACDSDTEPCADAVVPRCSAPLPWLADALPVTPSAGSPAHAHALCMAAYVYRRNHMHSGGGFRDLRLAVALPECCMLLLTSVQARDVNNHRQSGWRIHVSLYHVSLCVSGR